MKSRTLAVLLMAFVTAQLFAGTNKGKLPQEQTSFCGDDAPDELVIRPTPLPLAVVNALMSTKEAQEARKLARRGEMKLNPSTSFKGTKVRLADSGDRFYLVLGSSPMSGADNDWFWLVRQSGRKASILLFVGANCVRLARTRTMGYRDVVTTWSSASQSLTETFKYDGKLYQSHKRKWRPVYPFRDRE